MKIQAIVSDVRNRVETAGKHYQGAFKAYVDAQRKALSVVTRNGQTLANTEIGAAKNIFAAAKTSFDKARADGVRKVVNKPQAYVPNGRDQIVSAYKDTIDLLVRTGNELTDVVSSGYKSVRAKLAGRTQPARKKATTAKRSTTRKTASAGRANAGAAKKTSAAKATAKRKTASTRTASAKTKSTTASAGTKPASAKSKTTTAATTTANAAASDSTS